MTYNTEVKEILKNKIKNDEVNCFFSLYENRTSKIDLTKIKTGKIGVLSIGKLNISQSKKENQENIEYGNINQYDIKRYLQSNYQYIFVRPVKKLSITILNKQLIYLEVENPITQEVLNLFDKKYIAKLPTFNYKGKDCYLFVIDATTNVFSYKIDFEVERTDNVLEDKLTLIGPASIILDSENTKLKENNFIEYLTNNLDKEINLTHDKEFLEQNKIWNELKVIYPSSFTYTFENTGLKTVHLNYNEIYFSGMKNRSSDFSYIKIHSNILSGQNINEFNYQDFWNNEGKITIKTLKERTDLEKYFISNLFEQVEPENIENEPNNNENKVEKFDDVITQMKTPEIYNYYELISNNLNKWNIILSLSSLNNITLPNDLKNKIKYLYENHKHQLDSLVKLIK